MSEVRLEGIRRVYQPSRGVEVVALDGVDLKIEDREIVLVMGPSGSGKTTLLQIVGALLTPTEGRVLVAGEDLSRMRRRELTRFRLNDVGFIFQTFNLSPALSARENVALPATLAGASRRQRMSRAAQLLERVGLEHRLNHYPDELSGGEKQRVAIARALMNKPSLILADEPTGNLDSSSGVQVLDLLRDVAHEAGATVLIVSHDTRIMHEADRVVRLEDGRIVGRDRKTVPGADVGLLSGSPIPAGNGSSADGLRDPVCHRTISPEDAVASREHDGSTYLFCSTFCVEGFDTYPDAFVPRR